LAPVFRRIMTSPYIVRVAALSDLVGLGRLVLFAAGQGSRRQALDRILIFPGVGGLQTWVRRLVGSAAARQARRIWLGTAREPVVLWQIDAASGRYRHGHPNQPLTWVD